MASSASAYQFNPHDPRYYQCCCCARLHIAALAKAIAIICIASNVISIWGALMGAGGLAAILWVVFVSGVMAVAVFQEHRPTLILLLVLQGLAMAAAVMLLALAFIGYFILRIDRRRFNFGEAERFGILVYIAFVFNVALMFWSFAVMLQFYTFLTDRERAGAVAVMYEARLSQQQIQPTSGPYRKDQRRDSFRPTHDHHISYPIYPVHRTPSLTPAASPIPTAPPVVITVAHSPPPYDFVEEKVEKNELDS